MRALTELPVAVVPSEARICFPPTQAGSRKAQAERKEIQMPQSNDTSSSRSPESRRHVLGRMAASAAGLVALIVTRGVAGMRALADGRAQTGISDITRIYRLDDNAALTMRSTFPRDVTGIQLTGKEAALAVDGNPVAALQVTYAAPDHSVSAGIWECEPGVLRLPGYPETEYCRMLSGDLVITNGAGEQQSFGPGDAFVVPKGFVGTWNMRTKVKKEWVSVK